MDAGLIIGTATGIISLLATTLAKLAWDRVKTLATEVESLKAAKAALEREVTSLKAADAAILQHREADAELLEATLDRMKMSVQLIIAKAGLKPSAE